MVESNGRFKINEKKTIYLKGSIIITGIFISRTLFHLNPEIIIKCLRNQTKEEIRGRLSFLKSYLNFKNVCFVKTNLNIETHW